MCIRDRHCTDPTDGLRLLDGMDLMLVKWSIVPNATSFIFNQCIANGFTPSNIRYAPSYLTLYNWLIMENGFVIMDKETVFHDSNICHIPLQKEKNINFCVYWHKEITNPAITRFIGHIEKDMEKDGMTEIS